MDLNGVKALPTGNVINFHNPGDYKYDINEIALLMSKVKRFNGFGTDVMTHSMFVAGVLLDITGNPHIALLGLLHDAHEAYTGDIATPVKHILGNKLENLERMVQRAILWQLNAKHENALGAERLIKLIDLYAMREEVRAMVAEGRFTLDNQGVWEQALRPVEDMAIEGTPSFTLQRAEVNDFIATYHNLCEQVAIIGKPYVTKKLTVLGEQCTFKVAPHSFLSQAQDEE